MTCLQSKVLFKQLIGSSENNFKYLHFVWFCSVKRIPDACPGVSLTRAVKEPRAISPLLALMRGCVCCCCFQVRRRARRRQGDHAAQVLRWHRVARRLREEGRCPGNVVQITFTSLLSLTVTANTHKDYLTNNDITLILQYEH